MDEIRLLLLEMHFRLLALEEEAWKFLGENAPERISEKIASLKNTPHCVEKAAEIIGLPVEEVRQHLLHKALDLRQKHESGEAD